MPRDPRDLLKAVAGAAGLSTRQDMSGLMAAIQMGQSLGAMPNPSSLPRDPALFTAPGVFAPLMPATTFPIDAPTDREGGPMPRVWQYPVGWNMPTGPRAYDAISFDMLEGIADRVDVVRKAIELRKAEVTNTDFDIVLRDDSMLRSHGKDYLKAERQAIRAWFEKPDRIRGLDWGDWVAEALEEILVKDALSIYPRLDRKGDLYAIQILDGKTIKPLIDMQGVRPPAPNPAYQQFIYGVPRSEFAITEDEPVATYDTENLFYLPKVVRAKTVYGFPPVEQVIIAATTYLRRELWWQSYFTDSDMPGMFVTASEGWNPDQVARFESAFHSRLSGDPTWRWRVKMLPYGSTVTPVKQPTFDVTFDEFLVKIIAMVFEVTPAELGFAPSGGLGGKGFSAEQADIQERKASQPDKMFLSRKLTQLVIRDYFHQPDLKLVFPEHEEDDARLIAETNRIYVSMGVRTINEVKNSLGDEPFDIEQANEPLIMTASGAVPLRSVQTEELAPAPAPAPVAEAAKAAESDGYVPTEAMAAAARRALAWKDDGRAGGTSVGLARAHQLVNRERLSRDTVRRMYSFFARHDVDKRATGFRQGEKGYPTPGRVAWDLWGGDAGASWSKTQWERIQAAEKAGNGDAFLFAELDAFEAYAARRVGRPNSRPFEFLLAPVALNKVLGEQPAAVKAATDRVRVERLMNGVSDHIVDAADSLQRSIIDRAEFVGGSVDKLREAVVAVFNIGSRRRFPDQGKTLGEAVIEGQQLYLEGFGDDILAGAYDDILRSAAVRERANLYTASIWSAHEQGRLADATDGGDVEVTITWHSSHDDRTCPDCAALSGRKFTEATLPFFPGQSGFGGGTACGPACRCYLTYKRED